MTKKQQTECPTKKTSIGGQALIEGIMMRGPEATAMAVRHVSGNILLEKWSTGGKKRAKIWTLPFVRGIFMLVDSFRYGYKCLMKSAELAGLEDEDGSETGEKRPLTRADVERFRREAGKDVTVEVYGNVEEEAGDSAGARTEDGGKEPPQKQSKASEKVLMTLLMGLSMILGVALAVGLFFFLPTVLFNLATGAAPAMHENAVLRAVFEGVLRIVIFVVYLALVSQLKDIKRVFRYHGAEHKTIFCYEQGKELTVENIREQRRFHPRCGTSFLILMLLVGILVSMFIHVSNPFLRTFIKLLTFPLVAGVGYELIKLAGRKDNLLTRIVSAPGMWLQHITTKEPDDEMIECAIAAMKAVIPDDPEKDNW